VKVVGRVLGVVALAIAALAGVGPRGTAGATTHRVPSTISRSAHVPYEGCPAKDVELTVTLSARTYGIGQDVHYLVRLHNLSAKVCPEGARSVPSLPGASPLPALQLGPCSSLPLSVENARGAQVFPDTGGLACPVLLGPSLKAHQTLRARGTWDRVEGSLRPARLPTPAPAGRYRLVLGGVVTVPFTLTDAPPTAALSARVGPTSPSSIERTAHVGFGGCAARAVTMRVAVAPHAGAHTMEARVSVHNGSSAWCGPRRSTGSLLVGPCGSVSAVVRDATGVDVYPGHEMYFCPDDTGRGVAPHATVSGSFRWTGEEDQASQGEPARWQQAPSGRYWLEVGGVLEVPFTLQD
jgi:hypothetical protein